MNGVRVVVAMPGLNAAARREAAAIAQQQPSGSPASGSQQGEVYRVLEQASREVEQQVRAAAQAERDAALEAARDAAREAAREAARAGTRSRDLVQEGRPAPVLPGQIDPSPKVTVTPDGRTTIVNPDGKTTVIEPNGRVTTIDEDGRVTHSASAIPGENVIPNDVREMSMLALVLTAFVIVARPLAGAFGRRMDRRGPAGVTGSASVQSEMNERMQRIEQAVEAVAIEVERVSEGQRFTTKLLSEIRSPASLAVGERRA
jgi:hypothetical protein